MKNDAILEPPEDADPDKFDEAEFMAWFRSQKRVLESKPEEMHIVFFDDSALQQNMKQLAIGMGWDGFLPAMVRLPKSVSDSPAFIAFGLGSGQSRMSIGAPLEVIVKC